MKLDIQQSAITSDTYFSLISSWGDAPFTMTTTILDTTATRRWSGDSCGETISIDMWSTSGSSPSPTATDVLPIMMTTPLPEWTSLPTQSSLPWHGTEDGLIDKPSEPIVEIYGLVPLHNMFTSWWSDQHEYIPKQVLEKLIATMEVVWSIFRKVYHYPLDPP